MKGAVKKNTSPPTGYPDKEPLSWQPAPTPSRRILDPASIEDSIIHPNAV
jgi:hypothetical protein